ncbi:hypothetical protein H8E77_24365 [bacterium]|nr:hypothetical protein [bacterium]
MNGSENKNQLLDLPQFIDVQSRESFRAFFIVGRANSGKSRFVRKVAGRAQGYYLNLLELFMKRPDLSEMIDSFRPEQLERLLLSMESDSTLFIVDDIDFLLNTWTNRTKDEFVNRFLRLRSGVTDKIFCFVVQEDDVFEKVEFRNTMGQARILNLHEIADI